MSKFRTLFHVLDTEGVGHLTPGSLAIAMRDVYDAAGLLGAADPHRDAIRLYNAIQHGADCRCGGGGGARAAGGRHVAEKGDQNRSFLGSLKLSDFW